MKITPWALGLPLLLAGCSSNALKVSNVPGEGIPFLPILSVDVTELTFEQRWAEVELWTTYQPEMPGPKSDKRRFTARQIRFATDVPYVGGLLKTLNEQSTPLAAHEKLALKFANDPDKKLAIAEPAPLPIEEVLKLPPAGIERSREQAPATKPLYLNAPLPFGGSATTGVQLAPNGSLAGTYVQADHALPKVALEAAGHVAAALVGGAAVAAEVGGVPIVAAGMRVDIVRRIYKVVVRRPSEDARPCDIAALLRVDTVGRPPPEASTCSASLTITVVRDADKKGREKAENRAKATAGDRLPPGADKLLPPPPWADRSLPPGVNPFLPPGGSPFFPPGAGGFPPGPGRWVDPDPMEDPEGP